MTPAGLRDAAERIADAILEAGKARKGVRRRIVAMALPLLAEAVEIGRDRGPIALPDRQRPLREGGGEKHGGASLPSEVPMKAFGAWLLARLREPSTYSGAAAVIGGMTFLPHAADDATLVTHAGVVIMGLIAMFTSEKGARC